MAVQAVPLPGTAPTFAWPSTGEAAATVVGVGTVGQVRGTQPVPIAGLAEVLAAYVALSDHHLAPGDDGPAIPVTADALTAYQSGLASQESEVPIAAGETLTELQVLEGLLIDSGADMATVLADWDAGNVTAFVAKMNTAATALGLTSTHITDPTGVDPATTSTAEDMVRLGQASLTIPVLRQIVSLGQTSLPMTNVVFNLNFDLGQDGIIGIKSGSDASAQGCYLFAAQQSIGGKNVTVVGAVLSQPGGALGPNTAAVDAGDALVKSVFGAVHSFTLFSPGQHVTDLAARLGLDGAGDGGRADRRDRMARPGRHPHRATCSGERSGGDRRHRRDAAGRSRAGLDAHRAAHARPAHGTGTVVAPHALSEAAQSSGAVAFRRCSSARSSGTTWPPATSP